MIEMDFTVFNHYIYLLFHLNYLNHLYYSLYVYAYFYSYLILLILLILLYFFFPCLYFFIILFYFQLSIYYKLHTLMDAVFCSIWVYINPSKLILVYYTTVNYEYMMIFHIMNKMTINYLIKLMMLNYM
jgi:hypothetical protein